MRAIQEAPTVEALDAALDKMINAGLSVTLWHSNAAIATAGDACLRGSGSMRAHTSAVIYC